MPLPTALALRLAKRGIIAQRHNSEEIIAEDYDTRDDEWWDPVKGYPPCPNKCNVYHECTPYCVRRWRNAVQPPNDVYLHLKTRLLQKYPLPNGWQEIFDEGCGQHYYWNMYNNLVSWLPPTHPRATFSESAARLREERMNKDADRSGDDSSGEEYPEREEIREISRKSRRMEPKVAVIERGPVLHKNEKDKQRDSGRRDRNEKRIRLKDNDLDPMDPAAYSDIQRGDWSSGLEIRGDAKTGVDTTASGPLFQMRPYPNPGAIMKANASSKPPPSQKKMVQYPELPK